MVRRRSGPGSGSAHDDGSGQGSGPGRTSPSGQGSGYARDHGYGYGSASARTSASGQGSGYARDHGYRYRYVSGSAPAGRYVVAAGAPRGRSRRSRGHWRRRRAYRLARTIVVAVSLLVVAGVSWGRGEEPGPTVTALPPGFTAAAHPAGSGTGTADHAPRPDQGPAARPEAAGTRTTASPGTADAGSGPGDAPHTTGPRNAPHRRAGSAATGHPRSRAPAAPTPRPAAAAPRRPAVEPAAPARAARKTVPPAGPRTLPRSRATRLLIPYLRLDAPVMDLGLDRDRRLTAPPDDDPKLVGWYRHGASPGEQGTAVAVGHLDTDSGPAVFAGLTELKPGRIVEARRADGRIAVYTVDKIKSYEKAHFPSQEVYGTRGRPELRLITCGGTYDRRKGYSGNLVVFAHLTAVH
ncbi:class F sortase [Streptomyces sp. NPDC059696]|uniref:class F sortase n=1 Tax=Streptomyces sp. NPDC059696 TaxID=3346911 RepID=UPI003684D1EA